MYLREYEMDRLLEKLEEKIYINGEVSRFLLRRENERAEVLCSPLTVHRQRKSEDVRVHLACTIIS